MRLKTMRTAGPKVPGRIVTEPENCWKGWGTVNLYASTSTSRTEPPSGSPRSLPVQLTGRVIGVAVASVLPASAPVPQSFCGGRGTTVIPADMLPVGSVAVMVTGVGALTGKGVMSNCPSVEPAGTVTVAGTVAARGLLPESPTVTSDVAIAVTLANPCIVVTNREVSTGGGVGKTVSSAVLVTPPRDAEIVTGVGAEREQCQSGKRQGAYPGASADHRAELRGRYCPTKSTASHGLPHWSGCFRAPSGPIHHRRSQPGKRSAKRAVTVSCGRENSRPQSRCQGDRHYRSVRNLLSYARARRVQ